MHVAGLMVSGNQSSQTPSCGMRETAVCPGGRVRDARRNGALALTGVVARAATQLVAYGGWKFCSRPVGAAARRAGRSDPPSVILQSRKLSPLYNDTVPAPAPHALHGRRYFGNLHPCVTVPVLQVRPSSPSGRGASHARRHAGGSVAMTAPGRLPVFRRSSPACASSPGPAGGLPPGSAPAPAPAPCRARTARRRTYAPISGRWSRSRS